ncbi:hypothetical protein AVEN_141928-1 [Araneus ventricosus]|uniref:Uncharacterized protein n=1 Tax=Araneus ventricosus TaxID=182803 RepID=A0A4Y2K5W0_ARAVE|nr:hypothetical protein AVEN_141928-1 [Araneus ventricosus]
MGYEVLLNDQTFYFGNISCRIYLSSLNDKGCPPGHFEVSLSSIIALGKQLRKPAIILAALSCTLSNLLDLRGHLIDLIAILRTGRINAMSLQFLTFVLLTALEDLRWGMLVKSRPRSWRVPGSKSTIPSVTAVNNRAWCALNPSDPEPPAGVVGKFEEEYGSSGSSRHLT